MSVTKPRVSTSRYPGQYFEVAVAAVATAKNDEEADCFIHFLINSLKRNSDWINKYVAKRDNFKVAVMTGDGPNRFLLRQIIYPAENAEKLELELKDAEDYDKIAVAALLTTTNRDIGDIVYYMKNRLQGNKLLYEDITKGKAMGMSYIIMKPIIGNQYKVEERLQLPTYSRKKKSEDKIFPEKLVKKVKRVA